MNETGLELDHPSLFSVLTDPVVVLEEVAAAVADADASGAWLRSTLELVSHATRANQSALFLVEQDRPSLAACSPTEANVDGLRTVAVWTVASGVSVHLPCPAGRCAAPPIVVEEIPTVVVAPLRVGGETLGALVAARDAVRAPFDEAERRLLEVAARQIAVGVDRRLAHDQLAERGAEANATRRQLEAYARDVRATYAREKQRTVELEDALTELERTYLATVRGLAVAIEAKDACTAGHLTRVTRYGLAMVEALDPNRAHDEQLEYGFLLHDIGKLAIPDAILGKAGSLSSEEWAVIREHPAVGRRILADIPFLGGALEIVYAHHERWDGQGYPEGIGGEDLPFGARVFPLADALDAMTSDRPYRRGMTMAVARDRLAEASGTQFWPDAVEALLSIPIGHLEELRREPGGQVDVAS